MQSILLSSAISKVPVYVLAKNQEEVNRLQLFFLQWAHKNGPYCFTDYSEAMKTLGVVHTAVVLISYHFGGNRGFDAARELHSNGGELRIAGYSFSTTERQLCSMIHAGALSYFTEKCRAIDLLSTIEEIVMGRRYYNDEYTMEKVDEVKLCIKTQDAWWRKPFDEETIYYARELYLETKSEKANDHDYYILKRAKKTFHISTSYELLRTLLREDIMEK
jgi:hypothetical protein